MHFEYHVHIRDKSLLGQFGAFRAYRITTFQQLRVGDTYQGYKVTRVDLPSNMDIEVIELTKLD